VECVYIENAEDKLVYGSCLSILRSAAERCRLDPATRLMVNRLDQILKGVEGINSQFALLQHQGTSSSYPKGLNSSSNMRNILTAHVAIVS
jgi:hypothetical protein